MKWGGRRAARLRTLTRATYGSTCIYCGCAIPPDDAAILGFDPGYRFSAAHLLPRSRGGLDTIANLRPSHLRCNQTAGDQVAPMPPENGRDFFNREPHCRAGLRHSFSPGPYKNAPEIEQ